MKKLGVLFVVLLMLAALSVSYFGLSAQEAEALLLIMRGNSETEARELYTLNAATGEERLITDLYGLADAGWSPDGRIWVVESLADEFARSLRFIDARTGEESNFEDKLYHDNCYPAVYWSPNGEQMAYVSTLGNDFFLNLQNLTTGSSYQVGLYEHEMPIWSPDSQYLYLGINYASIPSRLIEAEDVSIVSEINYFINFSPDSRYISYLDAENHLQLYEIATGESIALGDSLFGVWSPSGRYFMSQTYAGSESLSNYDSQSQSLQSIDIGFPTSFASWSADESAVLLYSDFVEYFEDARPTKLIRYELASGETETLIEGTSWIGDIYRTGDWLAIRYSSNAPEDHFSPTNHLLFWNGESRIEAELIVGDGWLRSSTSSLPNERGILIDAEDGLYHFDSQTASLETITLDATGYSLWTADGAYIAFVSVNQPDRPNTLNIWNTESKSFSVSLEVQGHPTIIGWQGSPLRESLLYCGEG